MSERCLRFAQPIEGMLDVEGQHEEMEEAMRPREAHRTPVRMLLRGDGGNGESCHVRPKNAKNMHQGVPTRVFTLRTSCNFGLLFSRKK